MWNVKALTDKAQILAFLETDRLYGAYAIGDLEPYLFEQAEWFGAERNNRLSALAMHFRGVKSPVLFLMGDKDGLRSILEKGLFPELVYVNCRTEHIPVIREICPWDKPIAMWRMTLNKNLFHVGGHNCTRLTPAHAEQLKCLYDLGGMEGFTEGQIQRGIFYGLFDDERLIAAAGTHLISAVYGVAAIGNVFTHPDHRGKGFGAAATGAVSAELMTRGIRDIVLNAAQNNISAVHIYMKLGFECYCSFFEGGISLPVSGNRSIERGPGILSI